jgi:hypothetical protein
MNLTSDEKKLIVSILDTHLSEVQKNEELADQQAAMLGAEVNYEKFLKDIIRKIKAA